ncbi:hypothetical protein VRHSUH09_03280 [Veillonella rogosae JCM 15642]|uniref:Pilus assembly protein PilP n=1 Tax=Veillonella rogosae JCM 15642 TaxID=1298595 RepID=A0ABX5BYX4_9FIRM|nr:hypothetical protein [Veillonella rogosae]PQL13769.1 hypothetical protein VRHSUH09_03280 [Veillonella rogosae JCM 15642]
MNLQDYIEQIKGWIGRQCFLVRHYRIAIFIFFILALAMIVVGIFYPHEEEHININSAQSEGTIDNQRKVDDSIVKGRLLYEVSSVERHHPWREVFKDISSTDLLSQSDEMKDMDNDLDTISDDETSLSDSKKISNKRTSRQHRSTKNQTIKTDRKNKDWNSNMPHDDTNNYSNKSVHSRTGINSNALALEQQIELVGIIEGNQKIAILRRGSEEQMVTIGSSWQGISVSTITENSVEIVEGGSSRWLKIE